jgi:hypothetical protein
MSYAEAVSARKITLISASQSIPSVSSDQAVPSLPPSPGSPNAQMSPDEIDAPFALWRIPEDRNGLLASPDNQPLLTIPYVVIVPLYHKIRVKILDIQSWLFILNGWLDEDHCLEGAPREFLEWDVYLTDLYEMKSDLAKVLGGNKNLLSKKRFQRHPRFIWRATLKYHSHPLMDLFGDATDIGGSANPFYDVLFYNRDLEWKFHRLFRSDTPRPRGRVIDRQLDNFFYKYFAENPF